MAIATRILPKVKVVSMRRSVEEALKRALLDGRFKAGQSLSEAELAVEMGVSRGPVREALLSLVQTGLVLHSPNRGFSVVEFTQEDLRELIEVRIPLEATALKIARPHVQPQDLDELRNHKHQLVKAWQENRLRACSRSDMVFHDLIWRRSGNSRLVATMRNLTASFFAYGSFFSTKRPGLTPELLDEQHECFIRYLSGNDSRTAEECAHFHISN